MKLLATCFHALLVFGSAILALFTAADVSGTWAGSIDVRTTGGESNRVAIYLHLNQAGTEVTGTFGPTPHQQYRIEKGTINGDVVTFQVAAPTRVVSVRLKILHGGRMQGDVATADGGAYGEMRLAREADEGPACPPTREAGEGRACPPKRDARRRVGSWKL